MSGSARAETVPLAGYVFQGNAFADTVISSYTTDPVDGGFFIGPLLGGVPPASIAAAVTGPYPGDFAASGDPFSYVQLGFTDNVLRNGPGPDLALFDVGIAVDRFAVAISPSLSASAFREYPSTFTGAHFGAAVVLNRLNVALVDLSDFGVPEGSELASITIGLYPTTTTPAGTASPSLTAAAAFYSDASASNPNPVPAPPSLVLALVAGGVVLAVRGRKWLACRI